MEIFRYCLAPTIFILAASMSPRVVAQQRSAVVTATSQSVYQEAGVWQAPNLGTVLTLFTTYDGRGVLPLIMPNGDVSGELRPRAGQPNVYESDYFNFHEGLGIYAFGSGILSITAQDTDQNGNADIFQFNLASSQPYNGILAVDFPSLATWTIKGDFTKSVNSKVIHSTFTATPPEGPALAFTGNLELFYLAGSVQYDRTQQNLTFSMSGQFITNRQYTYRGSTSYTIDSANLISLPQFTLMRDDNVPFKVFRSSFRRSQNKYIGTLEVEDGLLNTTWRDYTTWLVEIVDLNDLDGNGIPDLSDSLPLPIIKLTASPRPNGRVRISWPSIASGTLVRSEGGSFPFSWTPVSSAVQTADGQKYVDVRADQQPFRIFTLR